MIMQIALKRVKHILDKFPRVDATVLRPVPDDYGQPSDTTTTIATIPMWAKRPARRDGWDVEEEGRTYQKPGTWLCVPTDDQTDIREGDLIVYASVTHIVRGIGADGGLLRYYWVE